MPIVVAAASALFFLGLHVLVRRGSGRAFAVDAMIARGFAGALLALTGFAALGAWWADWDEAFLGPRTADSVPSLIVWGLLGHLVADLAWFDWGRRRLGEPLRTDLVLHHLLGVAASVAALWLGAGQVAVVVVLSTELLPVTTGIRGLAKARQDERLERRALRAGLTVVVAWRIPLWLFLGGVLAWRLATGRPFDFVHGVALAALAAVLLLDVYWTRGYLALLSRPRRADDA